MNNRLARFRFASSRRKDRGVALVTVLWAVIVAGLMLLGVMKTARTNRALAHSELGAVQAHWLARAGVEQAIAVLEDDDPASDGATEDWYRNRSVFEKVDLGSGWFSVSSAADDNRPGLDDESGKLNLNSADKKQLTEFQALTETQIDSLIDWRSTGDQPSPNGAKAGYYQHLQYPYEMRGKDFQTHRELLLVRGFEDRSFFGKPSSSLSPIGPAADTTVYSYQLNRDPKGAPRVNLNTASAETLQQKFNLTPGLAQGVIQARNPQIQSLAALLDVKPQQAAPAPNGAAVQQSSEPPINQFTLQWLAAHVEEMTLNGDERLPGKININTASRDVLLTLPGMSAELADAFVTQRTSSGGAFRTLADVLDRHMMDENIFRGLFEKLTVRSDVFTVESLGVSSAGVQRRILAVIDRGSTPAGIIYWYQSP